MTKITQVKRPKFQSSTPGAARQAVLKLNTVANSVTKVEKDKRRVRKHAAKVQVSQGREQMDRDQNMAELYKGLNVQPTAPEQKSPIISEARMTVDALKDDARMLDEAMIALAAM